MGLRLPKGTDAGDETGNEAGDEANEDAGAGEDAKGE
jgi:hypothetical protein